ncbi:hypothetical protein KGF54_005547 [Candida jiufengensis]|uniref:uncharacterized protein n=1 Tax=Candida jiufengensis TaxID=497108 RepID=UPI0022245BDC|nr:uncharacterized protein KGF54_005547 [Candida jiufengensis]KAI5949312.1 hypothetical protein KGF54_005547 [Candida jiufengensis]
MSKKSDDVLEFLESLPDSKSGTPKPSIKKNDKEVFDFLDEIAEHEQKKPKKKFEPKKTDNTNNVTSSNDDTEIEVKPQEENEEEEEEENDPTTGTSSSDTTKEDNLQQKDVLENPIASISSWWQSEGNQKVSSLWGTITSNAEKISEQTYQLASTTTNQINEKSKNLDTDIISFRLNNIFSNISNQLKQGLIDDADEILNLLVVSDLYNINYINELIFKNFNSTMNQVEGNININVNELNHHHLDNTTKNINLNMFYGKLIDGEKLAFANLENSIKEYKKIEINKEKEKQDNDNKISSSSIVKSNIFITIQPITTRNESSDTQEIEEVQSNSTIIESHNKSSFSFTLILKDITNDITILTRTQPFPLRWAKWLDGEDIKFLNSEQQDIDEENVDPKVWVKDWIKQGLNLGFGILAQEYVIKRMGV